MTVCKYSKCEFVVYTLKDMKGIEIQFDNSLWEVDIWFLTNVLFYPAIRHRRDLQQEMSTYHKEILPSHEHLLFACSLIFCKPCTFTEDVCSDFNVTNYEEVSTSEIITFESNSFLSMQEIIKSGNIMSFIRFACSLIFCKPCTFFWLLVFRPHWRVLVSTQADSEFPTIRSTNFWGRVFD
jgi:hypothetical protein